MIMTSKNTISETSNQAMQWHHKYHVWWQLQFSVMYIIGKMVIKQGDYTHTSHYRALPDTINIEHNR